MIQECWILEKKVDNMSIVTKTSLTRQKDTEIFSMIINYECCMHTNRTKIRLRKRGWPNMAQKLRYVKTYAKK